MAAESGRRGELFHEHAPVGDNDPLRRDVVRARRDLDMAKPLGFRMLQRLAQRLPGISTTALPWHDGIANVAETVRGKRLGPGLPAQTGTSENSPAHIHIRYPASAEQGSRPERDWLTGDLSINQAGQKGIGIRGDRASSSCAASWRRLSGDQPRSRAATYSAR